MRITAIETHVCNARMRNWIFVKVLTDQDGLWGWGEATLEWHTREVVGAVEDLAPLLIGEDPTRVEHLWQMMFRNHFWHGNGVVRATAISGIDLALWDIVGKVHGVAGQAPVEKGFQRGLAAVDCYHPVKKSLLFCVTRGRLRVGMVPVTHRSGGPSWPSR